MDILLTFRIFTNHNTLILNVVGKMFSFISLNQNTELMHLETEFKLLNINLVGNSAIEVLGLVLKFIEILFSNLLKINIFNFLK